MSRRLRAARVASLVLIDGSTHAWLGKHHPVFALVGVLDDATGAPLSLVRRPTEDLHGYAQVMQELIVRHGVPEALYGDRTGIAVRNDPHWTREEELQGRRRPTQFGQMLEELGVRYIAANSPQAKGRIERHLLTLQDRLVADAAVHGIRTPEAFDAFLPRFIERCKKWFARARVEVRELLDGRLLVLKAGETLLEQAAPEGAFTLVPRGSAVSRRRPARQNAPKVAICVPTNKHARGRKAIPAGDRALLGRKRSKPNTNKIWTKRSYKTATQLTPR